LGTLFDQPERQQCVVDQNQIEDFLENAVELSKKHKVSVTDVIAAREVLELKRKNDLYVRNGDVFDEQLAGFGDLLRELISKVESLQKPSE
jgi:hypothetical protein